MLRYIIVFICALELMALPVHASGQTGEEGTAPRVEEPQPAQPNGSRLELWHPEAFKPPPDEPQIEYVPVESPETTTRRRRRAIALGVTIPLVVLGGVLAGVAISGIRNLDL